MNARSISEKIRRTTIKDQVYDIIKEMILSQKLQLGEKINIDTLVSNLKVSNSPIREALIKLENQGLVENIPNVGSRVISLTSKSFEDTCSTLFTIVSGSYDLCVYKNTIEPACQTMREILNQQKACIESTDMNTAVKIALTFDKCIVEATNNDKLLTLYEQFEDIYFLMALYSNQRSFEEHKQNIYEHTKILESIEQGDIAETKRWLFIHYDKHI